MTEGPPAGWHPDSTETRSTSRSSSFMKGTGLAALLGGASLAVFAGARSLMVDPTCLNNEDCGALTESFWDLFGLNVLLLAAAVPLIVSGLIVWRRFEWSRQGSEGKTRPGARRGSSTMSRPPPAEVSAVSRNGSSGGNTAGSTIRSIASVLAVVAAIAIWGSAAPVGIEEVASQIEDIEAAATLGDAQAESAMQQQVVYAQESAELSKIVAIQNSDQRPTMLLLVGVLLLAVFVATARSAKD